MYAAYYRLYWKNERCYPRSIIILVGVPLRDESIREVAVYARRNHLISIEECDRVYRVESVTEEEYKNDRRV